MLSPSPGGRTARLRVRRDRPDHHDRLEQTAIVRQL